MADGITISAAAVSAIVGAVATYLKMRSTQKVAVSPDPLHVETTRNGPYVTVGECKNYRCEIGKQFATMHENDRQIMKKLDEIDQRSEERANALHRRIDPFIEKVAANGEAVEFLKDNLRSRK